MKVEHVDNLDASPINLNTGTPDSTNQNWRRPSVFSAISQFDDNASIDFSVITTDYQAGTSRTPVKGFPRCDSGFDKAY